VQPAASRQQEGLATRSAVALQSCGGVRSHRPRMVSARLLERAPCLFSLFAMGSYFKIINRAADSSLPKVGRSRDRSGPGSPAARATASPGSRRTAPPLVAGPAGQPSRARQAQSCSCPSTLFSTNLATSSPGTSRAPGEDKAEAVHSSEFTVPRRDSDPGAHSEQRARLGRHRSVPSVRIPSPPSLPAKTAVHDSYCTRSRYSNCRHFPPKPPYTTVTLSGSMR
jgi:hypothetical protein